MNIDSGDASLVLFKGADLVLSRKVASFVEVYGRRIPVDQIPKVTVLSSSVRLWQE